MALQSDGKIVVCGYAFTGVNTDFAVVRYNADGSLDNTFSGDGKVTTPVGSSNDNSYGVALQPDGKIVVVGASMNGLNNDFAVVRYNADGSLDTTFDGDGKVTTPIGSDNESGFGVALQPDGKIVVSGIASTGSNDDVAVVRYNVDGSLDTTFSVDGKVTTPIGSSNEGGYGVAIQPDGKIVVAGHAWIGANNDIAVVRYTANGLLDPTFSGDGRVNTSIGSSDDFGYGVVIQPDGKIVVSGYSLATNNDIAVVRYTANGVLDTTFNGTGKVTTPIGTGSDFGFGVALQPDGKIVVSGYSHNGSNNDFAVVRYNASGALDFTFSGDGKVTTSIGSSSDVGAGVAIQPDGKIVLSGYSFIPGTGNDFAVVRLLGDSVCGNGSAEAGELCDDGNTLNGDCCSSTCQFEADGSPCTSDGLPCSADVCNASGTCTHDPSPFGTECRAAVGICDVAEACDGVATSCPADVVATSGVCRPAADVCDDAESCDGSGTGCPADAYLSSGECRAAAGACDLAESCDGTGIACPADAKSTAVCRPAAGDCDVAESCDGVADACPADEFAALGTPCRADAGQCDVAEECTGLSAACPSDGAEPDGTSCTDGNVCTMTDTCQGGTCAGADPLDCNDGNGCTTDSCDPIGGCENDDAPATGCLTAGKSIMLIKKSTDDTKDKLLWKWIKGAALTQPQLADPTDATGYALCVYAGTSNTLIADAAIPPGTAWSALGDKGYKFKGTSPDGLSLALLKGGDAGKAKALAKGKGAALPDPTLPLTYPVTAQLRKDGSPVCLESSFTAGDEVKNEPGQFKAKK